MLSYVLLAISNGILIGTSRAVNGRLGIAVGPLKASLWNHVAGFLLLTAVLGMAGKLTFSPGSQAPIATYLGGVFGALFVAVNSYVLPRIGAVKAVALVICGQMLTGVIVDARSGVVLSGAQFSGAALIVLGAYLASRSLRAATSVASKKAAATAGGSSAFGASPPAPNALSTREI